MLQLLLLKRLDTVNIKECFQEATKYLKVPQNHYQLSITVLWSSYTLSHAGT